MDFHNVRFPEEISLGAIGGPQRRVEIVTLANGLEERNQAWKCSKRSYNVSTGVKTLDELHEVIAFFEARGGMQYGFRWKDWNDFKSCPPSQKPSNQDQQIAIGDGKQLRFQLVKYYSSGDISYERVITKPIISTIMVCIDNWELKHGQDFELDELNGIIEMAQPPENGAPVTAGFEFDVPVRFNLEELLLTASHFDAGEIPNIPLIEIFE